MCFGVACAWRPGRLERHGAGRCNIQDTKVYDTTPRHQAVVEEWNITKTALIYINKGKDGNAVDRSRVSLGNGSNKKLIDALFASTPPLEAFGFLIHEYATAAENEGMARKSE